MAGKSTVFPAFLRLEYDQGDAKARFNADLKDIKNTIENAMKRPANGGAFDLGIGNLQKAKADAQSFAQTAKQVLSAAESAAAKAASGYTQLNGAIGGAKQAMGEMDAATRSYINAARATVTEANSRVQSIDSEIRSLQLLQAELNKTSSARGSAGKPDLRFGVDSLMAGKASIDSAALSMASLEQVMGRVSREGQKSRQTFMDNSRSADAMQRELDELRGSIDPLYYATRKYNDEQERANRLLAQGKISADEHGRAMQVAGVEYNTAMRNAAGSTSNLRQATVQTGQQLQDIAISLYSGQRAGTVFAQQLPQLAFALSSLEGSANKTHNRIGQFATLLSGPWGVAVGLAVGVLATYVAGLFSADEASNKAKETTYELTEAFDFESASISALTEATNQWLEVSKKAIRSSYEQAIATNAAAREKLNDAKSTIAQTRAQLELLDVELKRQSRSSSQYEGGALKGLYDRPNLEGRLDALEKGLPKLQETVNLTSIPIMQMEVNDPARVAKEKAERELNAEYASGTISAGEYGARLRKINQEYEVANKADRAAGKKPRKGRARKESTSYADGVSSFNSREEAIGWVGKDFQKRGFRVSENAQFGGVKANHPGMGNAAHGRYAIDVNIGTGIVEANSPQHRAQMDAAVLQYQALGYRIVWNGKVYEPFGKGPGKSISKGKHQHRDHAHVEAPASLVGKPTPNADFAAQDRELQEDQRRAEQQILSARNYANEIANINSQWDEQPRLIDQSNKAVRNLDIIMAELNSAENADLPNRASLLAQAQAARAQASNAVSAEMNRYFADGRESLKLMELQAQGLNEQAEIRAEINQMDRQLGLRRANDALLTKNDLMANNVQLAKDNNIELDAERKTLQAILADTKATNDEKAKATARIKEIGSEEKKNQQIIAGSLVAMKMNGAEIAKNEALQAKLVDGVTAEFYQRQQLNREIERANAIMDEQVGLVRDVESGLRGIFTGQNNAGDFFKGMESAFKQYNGNRLFDSIFGDAFDMLEDELRKDTPMGRATQLVVTNLNQAGDALRTFADTVKGATNDIQGNSADKSSYAGLLAKLQSSIPANDNGDIVVRSKDTTGKISQRARLEALSGADMANRIAKGIVDPLLVGWSEILGPKFMAGLSGTMTGALAGYMRAGNVGAALGGAKGIADMLGASSDALGYFDTALDGAEKGGQYNTVLRSVFGSSRTSNMGAQIGGGLGGAAGMAIGGPAGQAIGELAGSVIGSFIGGAFKKKKYGTATLSGSGEFGVRGNSGSSRDDAEGLGDSVMDGLNRISDALGGEIGSFSTSIGLYKGKLRVSTTGRTGKLKGKYGDVTDFGDDEEAAIRFAIADAIKDGAITGLRAATQRLLQAGDDVDAQLEKALDFEGVFTSLKAIKDPVGAALDTLDKEFQRLIGIFGEAGASTEEYAQLEELYGIRRTEAIEEANSRVLASLRGLLDDLTIGDAGLSLRSRLSSAQAAYDPLAARVAAGDTTAYDSYADAARQLLDLQREVYGSTNSYFTLLDEVTALTQSRVDAESNISSISAGRASPFDTTQVSTAVTDQTQILGSHLTAINDNIITLIETINANGGNTAGLAQIGNF